jgi:hypothetical protein
MDSYLVKPADCSHNWTWKVDRVEAYGQAVIACEMCGGAIDLASIVEYHNAHYEADLSSPEMEI